MSRDGARHEVMPPWRRALSQLWRIALLLAALGLAVCVAAGWAWGDLELASQGQAGKLIVTNCAVSGSGRRASYECQGQFVPAGTGSPPSQAYENDAGADLTGRVVKVVREPDGETKPPLAAWASGLGKLGAALFLFGMAAVLVHLPGSWWAP